MADYSEMNKAELEKEFSKQKDLVVDMQHERSFLGKQVGMHINASEFARLDRDIERTEEKIKTLDEALATQKA